MIKPSLPRRAAVVLVLAAWFPLQAQAGLLKDNEARKQLSELNTKVDATVRDMNARIDAKADKTIIIDLLNGREQAMQDMARLSGEVEVLAHQIENLQKDQKRLYADLESQIKAIGMRVDTLAPRQAGAAPPESRLYDEAMAVFDAGEYARAAPALQDLVRRFPDSPFTANARYALGNAYFAQRDYRNAIAAQQALVANHGDSPEAPGALLSIASSYEQLNDKDSARKALQRLVSTYPDAGTAAIARERLRVSEPRIPATGTRKEQARDEQPRKPAEGSPAAKRPAPLKRQAPAKRQARG